MLHNKNLNYLYKHTENLFYLQQYKYLHSLILNILIKLNKIMIRFIEDIMILI